MTGVLLPLGTSDVVRDGPAVIAGDLTLGVLTPCATPAGVDGVERLLNEGENGRADDAVVADTRETSEDEDGVERRGGRVGGVAMADGSTLARARGCDDDDEGVEVDAECVIWVATCLFSSSMSIKTIAPSASVAWPSWNKYSGYL
jgi:hypothetical protein